MRLLARRIFSIVAVVVAAATRSSAQQASASTPMIQDAEIRLDGRLDEPAWANAIGDDEPRLAPLADEFLVKLRWIFTR